MTKNPNKIQPNQQTNQAISNLGSKRIKFSYLFYNLEPNKKECGGGA